MRETSVFKFFLLFFVAFQILFVLEGVFLSGENGKLWNASAVGVFRKSFSYEDSEKYMEELAQLMHPEKAETPPENIIVRMLYTASVLFFFGSVCLLVVFEEWKKEGFPLVLEKNKQYLLLLVLGIVVCVLIMDNASENTIFLSHFWMEWLMVLFLAVLYRKQKTGSGENRAGVSKRYVSKNSMLFVSGMLLSILSFVAVSFFQLISEVSISDQMIWLSFGICAVVFALLLFLYVDTCLAWKRTRFSNWFKGAVLLGLGSGIMYVVETIFAMSAMGTL